MVINHVLPGIILQLVGGTLGTYPMKVSTRNTCQHCTSFVGFSEDNLGTKGDKLMGKHKMEVE